MTGAQPLDEQGIRQELRRRMQHEPMQCPQCSSDRLVVRKAASDFPGFHHQVIYCHACGLSVHIEQKLDADGRIVSLTVVGASGLNSSWMQPRPTEPR
jgi:transposase-like protein